MEFSKKTLLSILEQVNTSDVDEMARRPKGNRAANKDWEDFPPKFRSGWKDDNPTEPGTEGVPDYWVVNRDQEPGKDILFVPVTCNEIERYIEENKEWLDSLGVLHSIKESPQVIYCKKGLPVTHRPAERIFVGGYKPTGDVMSVGERIKRYSNSEYGTGLYDIIDEAFVEGDFANYLSMCNVPPIINEKVNRDRYSDSEIKNSSLVYRMISFDKYNSLNEFLRTVIEKIRPIANFEIPKENKVKSNNDKYLARLFSRIYRNWDPERQSDKKFYGYTEKYQLNALGYTEDEVNVLSSTFFEIDGKLRNNSYDWKISMSVKFGKKLQEDPRIKKLTEDKFITVNRSFPVDSETVQKLLSADEANKIPDSEKTPEQKSAVKFTIMDVNSIRKGLIATIEEFQNKVKQEITPQDALRLGRLTYKSATNLDEQKINFLIKDVIKETKTPYKLYHTSYTSAVNTALDYAESRGFTYDKEEVATKVGMGPKKPSEGKTNRITIGLMKNGKEQKKSLHFQVYNMGEKYELNAYIS